MNRRTFLKTLAALGASLPLDLFAATESEIDDTWERIRDVWGLFELGDFGTLSHANFEEPQTRFDAYGIDDATHKGRCLRDCGVKRNFWWRNIFPQVPRTDLGSLGPQSYPVRAMAGINGPG